MISKKTKINVETTFFGCQGAECHIEFIRTNRKECENTGGLRSLGSFGKGSISVHILQRRKSFIKRNQYCTSLLISCSHASVSAKSKTVRGKKSIGLLLTVGCYRCFKRAETSGSPNRGRQIRSRNMKSSISIPRKLG
jgi:hypothetical protein